LLEEEKEKALAAAEAHWRATFTPHAIVTEHDRASSIWLGAVLGVNRILDFDGSDPSSLLCDMISKEKCWSPCPGHIGWVRHACLWMDGSSAEAF
jgi:hypothetical protein